MSIAMPGYVPNVAAADALDPAWGNAIRDRAPQVFTTKVLRDASVTVPVVGQLNILTAALVAGDEGIYIYHGATVLWRPPWNMPWGRVATATMTTATSAVTTVVDITGATVTWTAVANRRYKISLLVRTESSVANDKSTVSITDASNVILTATDRAHAVVNTGEPHHVFWEETIAAGSTTRKGRVVRLSGTGNVKINAGAALPNYMTVDDMGPNGAPS